MFLINKTSNNSDCYYVIVITNNRYIFSAINQIFET